MEVAQIFYTVKLAGPDSDALVEIEICDAENNIVSQSKTGKGEIIIQNPQLWWPRGMTNISTVGYMYTFKVDPSYPIHSVKLVILSMYFICSG